MQPPLYIRPLSAVEEQELQAGLRSRDAFTLRRAQILRASARGACSTQIAAYLRLHRPDRPERTAGV
jgi:hypothetical protein